MNSDFRFYWEKPEKKYDELRIDVPGFRKDEIKVQLNKDFITISVFKKGKKVERGEGFYSEEISSRSFSKTLPLPSINTKDFTVEINDCTVSLKRKKKSSRKLLS